MNLNFAPDTLLWALLGGIVPALIWLYYVQHEDARCPEPRSLILIAFIAGMLVVPFALPLQHLSARFFGEGLPVLFAWAAIEETLKYVLAVVLVLWRRAVNETLDFVIYMITVALGFAALENALFLIAPLAAGDIMEGVVTNNLRFVGSTLLHVIASGTVGFALALAYLRTRPMRLMYAFVGLILAIGLHTLFNFLIIAPDGSHTLTAFILVWSGAVVGFALFEILRYLRYRHLPDNTC